MVFLPKSSGKDLAHIVPDAVDTNGNPIDAFYFDANVIVITNLDGIKDKALETRMNPIAIFMNKSDIIEKVSETADLDKLGITQDMADDIAELITDVVENGSMDIKNEKVTYRFFKLCASYIKLYPNRWQGKVKRKMGIGIRDAGDLKKRKENLSKLRKYISRFEEAEMSSRPNPKLWKMALQKAEKERNDWMMDLINAMNPRKLSRSDMDTLDDFLSM